MKQGKSIRPKKPSQTRQVRIIGGIWKRTPLAVIDSEGLRPTPDRVRETLFNWLTHLLDGRWSQVRCLDLFAGTGALGFEAASRGATQVLMVEHNTPAVRQLEQTKAKLDAAQVQIQRTDALSALQNAGTQNTRFHLIFLDPPYHLDWLAKTLPLCERLLETGGLVYVEAEFSLAEPDDGAELPGWMDGWQVVRSDKAGMVFYHLLQRQLT
ncbi:16S rRNA (guanine(966)-N(2))-methyltransferase RsmD [Glaciimonas soli]|uniref:16S rRNA (Guanine(966)-N(2))-methyltransferase RsmD n=1 Tax=Glaciimonas soli TaxID=2590999 RepID=A0A843YUT5_9BURK|nr:16S rRNA (guanine(966)-N(2))-methyltransferase RsmD [Glaciimonas soli]MQR00386.1 16S rRNA (guanine(966)-N(2))-methyltransferase RsmD [Glaciimonas soli]